MLPGFAKPIAEARARGKRPVHMVLVSDGDLGMHKRFPKNPVVRLLPTDRPNAFDWTFLADLDVEIVTTGDAPRIQSIIEAIKPARPFGLWVWNLRTGQRTRILWLQDEWYTREWQEG